MLNFEFLFPTTTTTNQDIVFFLCTKGKGERAECFDLMMMKKKGVTMREAGAWLAFRCRRARSHLKDSCSHEKLQHQDFSNININLWVFQKRGEKEKEKD